MGKRRGLTLAELLVTIGALAVLATLLLTACDGEREEARRIRCRNSLNQLAVGLAIYLHEFGNNKFYPCPLGRGQEAGTYNGAEWLAALYWTGILPDPGCFLCPSSGDTNAWGKDIGCKRANDSGGKFSSQTVSYAGMWWKSVTQCGGAIRDEFPPNEPMACDDTQGTINHGSATNGGMSVLFFDSHVEFHTNRELDITTEHGSVGKKPGLLWRLKN
jgi:prepilin-type N-terminal cleavage/methylation domain-containing protein/prepilin-type processing-associated H-X9-DG protein